MKLGAVDYHFEGRNDTERLLHAKELGLDGLEVIVRNNELMAPDQRRLAELRAAKEASHLEISSLMLVEHNSASGIASSDPGVAERASQSVQRAIDWAATLGARVVLVPFFGAAEIRNAEDFERVGNAFRKICPYAASKSVFLGFESTLPADDVLKMIEYVGEEGFGCYFDTGNTAFFGQDVVTEIQKLGRHIVQVHIKDTHGVPGVCVLGHGLVDFPASAQALREAGYEAWIVCESAAFPSGPEASAPPQEEVARDIGFIRRTFPELQSSGISV